MKARWLAAYIAAAALLAGPPGAHAQQNASVEGRVRDEQGVAVYSATVLLIRSDSLRFFAESDRLGFFRVAALPPGSYHLRASRLGHADHEEDLTIAAGARVALELVVPRAAVAIEGVGVEAARSRAQIRFEEIAGRTVHEIVLQDLRNIPGIAEADVLRAVEVLPGVVSTSDFSSAFHVRGGSADQNLILLDGIPVISPFHLGGFFSVFNSDMLARAELSSGGFPAKFGGRVSSVLEIESDPGDGTFRVDGGVSVLATRVAVAGGLPSGLGLKDAKWRVSGRRSYFDVLMKPVFDFPYHLTDLQGVFEGWTSGGDLIRISGYSGADVLDLSKLNPEEFPLRIQWDWGNDLLGASWTRARENGGSLEATLGYTRYGTGLGFADFGDTRLNSRVSDGFARVDLRAVPGVRWHVDGGVSADRMMYDNLFESGGTVFNTGTGTGWLLGGYAQADYLLPGQWSVEAGVRLDSWMPDPGERSIELAPRIAVKRFLFGGAVAVKGAVGRYSQFIHSIRDEELPVGLDIWVLAGAHAPRQVSDQVQGGVETFIGDDWQLTGEAYWRRFDGVITINNGEDPNDPFDDNLRGKGTSWGWDMLVRRNGAGVNGWVALSWLKARRTFPDVLSPFDPRPELTYSPVFDRRLDMDVMLRLPVPGGWEAGLRWNVGSGIPYTRPLGSYALYVPRFAGENGRLYWPGTSEETDTFGGYAVDLGQRNADRYPAYHRLDASFRKTYQKSWGRITPYVDILNVYNQKNVLFYFYEYEKNPATRSGISMFPLLPTLGVEASFR